MLHFITSFTPLILFAFFVALLVGCLKYWEWDTKRSKKRSPLTQDLLRGPGESLSEKINDISLDMFALMLSLIITPIVAYTTFTPQFIFSKKLPSNLTQIIVITICLIVGFYLLYKIYGLLKLRRQYTVGLEAEMAVGQELNLLMRKGYWVFHDFPAGKFNIDHVVIGRNGVFAVETKGRPKRFDKNGKLVAEVTFNGTELSFPGWSETKPIDQAIRQAKWLQDWLTKRTGQAVNTQPVLALPGWFIKRTAKNGLPIINGKNPSLFFEKYGTQELTEQQINQIVFQVDQQCRNIAPRSYKTSLS